VVCKYIKGFHCKLLQTKGLEDLTYVHSLCTIYVMDTQLCYHCSRPAVPHCPQCGSLRKYGFANRSDRVTRPDNTIVHLRVYRCLTCASTYNDDDWQLRCQAPAQRLGRPPGRAGQTSAKAAMAQEQLDAIKEKGLDGAPPELVARIMEYRKKGLY
jgi:hypothetical protein